MGKGLVMGDFFPSETGARMLEDTFSSITVTGQIYPQTGSQGLTISDSACWGCDTQNVDYETGWSLRQWCSGQGHYRDHTMRTMSAAARRYVFSTMETFTKKHIK